MYLILHSPVLLLGWNTMLHYKVPVYSLSFIVYLDNNKIILVANSIVGSNFNIIICYSSFYYRLSLIFISFTTIIAFYYYSPLLMLILLFVTCFVWHLANIAFLLLKILKRETKNFIFKNNII